MLFSTSHYEDIIMVLSMKPILIYFKGDPSLYQVTAFSATDSLRKTSAQEQN